MIDDAELMTLRQQEEREAAGDAVPSAPRAQADDFLDARPVEDVNTVSGTHVSTVSGTHDAGTLDYLHRPFFDNVAVLCMGLWVLGVSGYQTTSVVPPS